MFGGTAPISSLSGMPFLTYECYGTLYVNSVKIALLSILPGSLQTVKSSAFLFFLDRSLTDDTTTLEIYHPPPSILTEWYAALSSVFYMEQMVAKEPRQMGQVPRVLPPVDYV